MIVSGFPRASITFLAQLRSPTTKQSISVLIASGSSADEYTLKPRFFSQLSRCESNCGWGVASPVTTTPRSARALEVANKIARTAKGAKRFNIIGAFGSLEGLPRARLLESGNLLG